MNQGLFSPPALKQAITAWSASGGLITTDRFKKVSLQANFPECDYYTVQFDITPPNLPVVAPGVFRAQAEIFWSVKGNTTRRVISVGSGTTISGPGEAVGVSLSDVSPSPGFGINPYSATITVTKGCRPSSVNPPILAGLTGSTFLLALATITTSIPINSGVKSAYIIVSATAFANLPVKVIALLKDPAGVSLLQWDPTVEVGFMPLIPGGTSIDVVSLDAAHTQDLQIIWGIDG